MICKISGSVLRADTLRDGVMGRFAEMNQCAWLLPMHAAVLSVTEGHIHMAQYKNYTKAGNVLVNWRNVC